MVSETISSSYSECFSPFPHGTCSLSVSQEYLALPDGAGSFNGSFTGSRLLRILLGIQNLPIRDFHPLWSIFPDSSRSFYKSISQSYNPIIAETIMVWAISISLATTPEITIVFSSYAYLDVSVQRVCPLTGNISSIYWVAPFGNQRIKNYLHLPVAYRSLSRPSSPLRAKAFPVCPQ